MISKNLICIDFFLQSGNLCIWWKEKLFWAVEITFLCFHWLSLAIYFFVVLSYSLLLFSNNYCPTTWFIKLIKNGHCFIKTWFLLIHHFILFLFEGNVLNTLWPHILLFSHIFILLPTLFSSFGSFFTVSLQLLNDKISTLSQVQLYFLSAFCFATNTFTVLISIVNYADFSIVFDAHLFL